MEQVTHLEVNSQGMLNLPQTPLDTGNVISEGFYALAMHG